MAMGIAERIATQEAWIDGMKQQCQVCHQLGSPETRALTHWGDGVTDAKQAWDVRLSMLAHAASRQIDGA